MRATGLPDAILAAARSAYDAGLCVWPPTEDGDKRPDGRWKGAQRTRPSPDHMRAQFATRQRAGIGLICGQVSGGLECLEFDDRTVYEQFTDTARQVGLGDSVERIEQGYCEDSPSGGVHWPYKCDEIDGATRSWRVAPRRLTSSKTGTTPSRC